MTQVAVDPDPTPTVTPWQEYLAAARSLDAVRRQAASVAAGQHADASQGQWQELAGTLEQQRARITGEAVRAGLPAPRLVPGPAEHAAVAGIPVSEALRRCRSLLAGCDAQLAAPPAANRGTWRPAGSLVGVLLAGAAALLVCFGLVLLALLVSAVG